MNIVEAVLILMRLTDKVEAGIGKTSSLGHGDVGGNDERLAKETQW